FPTRRSSDLKTPWGSYLTWAVEWGYISMNGLEARSVLSSGLLRGAAMNESRVIKKYPNRRLYDTVESRYITLADIRRLVMDKVDFVVIDKKSQEDITRSILLQVIAEQEHT